MVIRGITLFCLMLFPSLVSPSESGSPTTVFVDAVDALDRKISENEISSEYALSWWEVADRLVLDVYGRASSEGGLGAALARITGDDPECHLSIEKEGVRVFDCHSPSVPQGVVNLDPLGLLYMRYASRKNMALSWTYFAPSPSDGWSRKFEIESTPLDVDRAVYLLKYSRTWMEEPTRPNGPSQEISTLRIMEHDERGGKPRIMVRLEDTSFYKKFIVPGKFEYWPPWQGGAIPPYLFGGGSLVRDSVKADGMAVSFDTRWNRCRQRLPNCDDEMTISWVYEKGKLRATRYVDRYRGDYDFEKGRCENFVDEVDMDH